MCSSLLSRNSAFHSNHVAKGLLNECCIFVTTGMSVITRASPTHSSESNGGAQRAVQSVRGLARTQVTQVEHRTGLTFGADSPLWLWAFRHAGWILTRFGRRRDTGMTPYAKLFCKQYRQPLLMFAEAVIARRPGAQVNRLEHHGWMACGLVAMEAQTNI